MRKTTHPAKPLIKTADAAKLLGVHVATVARMVADGRLVPAVKVPGKTGAYLFNPEDVTAVKEAS